MPRILVLQLKRMSDLLLTTPALAALRQNPEAHITLAIDTACRELLPAFSFIDDSFVFSRKAGNRAFWQKLIFSGFDICLDFTGNDRSAICSILSKSHQRITFRSASKSQLRIFYNEFVASSARDSHTIDHYLHLLDPLKIKPQQTGIQLNLPDWPVKKAQQLLDETRVEEPYILVHPGSTRPEKYWLAERWADVIDFCKNELGLPCVVTGSKETYESEHIAAIKAKTPFHDLSGRTDLLSLAALARRARLLLSVDSVAMQFGAAFQTRQIALFGKTNPFHWRPRHENAFVIQAGNPRVNAEFTPQARSAPMSEISTQQVIDAIRTSMSQLRQAV
ncbi:MAG: glycosyltransferase family 9 protein [Chthoniobacteraceae bacterium]